MFLIASGNEHIHTNQSSVSRSQILYVSLWIVCEFSEHKPGIPEFNTELELSKIQPNRCLKSKNLGQCLISLLMCVTSEWG